VLAIIKIKVELIDAADRNVSSIFICFCLYIYNRIMCKHLRKRGKLLGI